MQQYADIYLLQSFALNKYLHTVASVGFLFAEKYIIYRSGRDYSNFKKHVLVLVAFLRVLTQSCKKCK